jgi:hypothetical protein
MRWMRYVLLAASLGGAGFARYGLMIESVSPEGTVGLALMTLLCVLNFSYLLRNVANQ